MDSLFESRGPGFVNEGRPKRALNPQSSRESRLMSLPLPKEACPTCLALCEPKVGKAPYRSPPQAAKSAQREAELAYVEAE